MALLAAVLLAVPSAASQLSPLVLSSTPPEHRHRARRLLHPAHAATEPPTAHAGPLFRPTDFGADATGKQDASNAFDAAVAAMLARAGSRELASGNRDLGGATLDLSGGTYLISEPVHIPMLHANFRITGGTLRAAASFPKDRYMIEIGACADEAPCPHPPTPAPSLLPLPPTDP